MSNVTLHLGDCLEVLPTISAASVDAVITDPPYILAAGSTTHQNGKAGTWGDMMNAAYWFANWYSHVWRILKPNGCFWSFCNWKTLPIIQKAAMSSGISITSVMVWDKKWIGPGGNQGLRPRYELIALMAKENFSIENRGIPDIIECMWSANKPSGHAAEKPEKIMSELMKMSLPKNSVVMDCFMGSGTTGEAAVKLNHDFIGIEADEKWFSYSERRIKQAQEARQLEFA